MKIFELIADWIGDFWDWAGWKTFLLIGTTVWFTMKSAKDFFVSFINDILQLVQSFTNINLSAASTTFFTSNAVQLGNYLFPFDVLLQSLALVIVIYPIAVTIRVIKSWFPTVSG